MSFRDPARRERLKQTFDRRWLLKHGGAMAAATSFGHPLQVFGEQLPVLEVAYAGSMGSLMEGPLKRAVAASLRLELHGRGQGASALGQLIASGSITPDVFLPITATPMRAVFQAGKASLAEPIARTEMVIAYSAKSRFALRQMRLRAGSSHGGRCLRSPDSALAARILRPIRRGATSSSR